MRTVLSWLNTFAQVGMTLLLCCVAPLTTAAQTSLQSTNYQLDGVSFGSNFTLVNNQSSVPPQISSEGPTVTEITPTTVTITWKTDKASSSTVQYGTTTAYGLETGNSERVTTHTVTIFGLTPETIYHYRVKSTDAFNSSATSPDKTFTTPAEAGINSISITDVSYDKALVSWTTGLFTLSRIEYGTTTRYGQTKTGASRGFLTSHTMQLTDLTPGTLYHLRIVAEDDEGNITRSSDFSFTTFANPAFVSVSASSPSPNELTLSWETNTFTTGIITYKSDKDAQTLSAGDTTLTANHTVTLKNLIGLTQYTYTIVATDNQGRQVNSGPRTATTQSDTKSPEIKDLKVNVTRSGEELVLTVTWKTDEPAKGQLRFNPKNTPSEVTELPESTSFSNEHVMVSTGIDPSTPYSLTVAADDPYGNSASQEIKFATPGLRKSVVQLILDSILNTLGWVPRIFGTNS